MYPDMPTAQLATQHPSPQVYKPRIDEQRIADAVTEILLAIGEDPQREGLRNTPKRVARFWREFIDYDAGNTETAFESVKSDQLVLINGMRIWSLCEHHLLPFWCDISIGYITKDKVLGLSKFGRIAHLHAHRLNLQEQLVESIAADLKRLLSHEDVAVIAHGEHLCMTMRGIRTPHTMVSSSMSGVFREDALARQEFIGLATHYGNK
jgi:GTP cyclohydrolase I